MLQVFRADFLEPGEKKNSRYFSRHGFLDGGSHLSLSLGSSSSLLSMISIISNLQDSIILSQIKQKTWTKTLPVRLHLKQVADQPPLHQLQHQHQHQHQHQQQKHYQSVSISSKWLTSPLCIPVTNLRTKFCDCIVKPGTVSGRSTSILRTDFDGTPVTIRLKYFSYDLQILDFLEEMDHHFHFLWNFPFTSSFVFIINKSKRSLINLQDEMPVLFFNLVLLIFCRSSRKGCFLHSAMEIDIFYGWFVLSWKKFLSNESIEEKWAYKFISWSLRCSDENDS